MKQKSLGSTTRGTLCTPLVAAELEISLAPDPDPEDQALCCTLLGGVASEIYGPAMASSPMSSIERREAGTHTMKEFTQPAEEASRT